MPASHAPDRTRAALWMLGGGAFQAGAAFGANLWLMHLLAPEVFGLFAVAGASLALVLGLGSLRPAVLAIRCTSGDEREIADRFGRWTSLECAVLGSLTALVLLACGVSAAWIWVLLLSELVLHQVSTAKALVERRQPYAELALVEGGSAFAGHTAAIALALTGAGVFSLVARQAILGTTQLVWLARRGAAWHFAPVLPTPRLLRARLHEARDVWTDGLLESLFSRTLVLAAGHLGGARGAGYLSQAWRLALVPHQLLQPLAGRLALNWASRASTLSDRSRQRRRLLSVLVVPLAACAAGAALFADPIVPLLFGERWRPVAPLLVACSGAILGASPFALLKMHLIAARRGRALLLARAVQLGSLLLGWTIAATTAPGALAPLAVGAGVGLLLPCPGAWLALKASEKEAEHDRADPASDVGRAA